MMCVVTYDMCKLLRKMKKIKKLKVCYLIINVFISKNQITLNLYVFV